MYFPQSVSLRASCLYQDGIIVWRCDLFPQGDQLFLGNHSGILNDPNDWVREHDDPKYILNLLKSIITVSLETMKIVKGLPELREIKP